MSSDVHDEDLDAELEEELGPRRDRTTGSAFRRRLSEQLTGLLDPEGALRRGQDIVTGVTQATKDEVIRIVGAEVRNFLDKMDAVDLLQEVISGLTIDVDMKIRFSRDADGPKPEIRSNTRIESRMGASEAKSKGGADAKPKGNAEAKPKASSSTAEGRLPPDTEPET